MSIKSEKLNKLCVFVQWENYQAIKLNELELQAAMWMNFLNQC